MAVQDYVVQSIITSTADNERSRIIKAFLGSLQNSKTRLLCDICPTRELTQSVARHKYASNVLEKALKQAEGNERRAMIDELIGEQPDGTDQIQKLLKDACGNFPVQVSSRRIAGATHRMMS